MDFLRLIPGVHDARQAWITERVDEISSERRDRTRTRGYSGLRDFQSGVLKLTLLIPRPPRTVHRGVVHRTIFIIKYLSLKWRTYIFSSPIMSRFHNLRGVRNRSRAYGIYVRHTFVSPDVSVTCVRDSVSCWDTIADVAIDAARYIEMKICNSIYKSAYGNGGNKIAIWI